MSYYGIDANGMPSGDDREYAGGGGNFDEAGGFLKQSNCPSGLPRDPITGKCTTLEQTTSGDGGNTNPMQTFLNTSPTKPSLPTGIPDPNNPGYDTAGYRLGSTVVDGKIIVPNTVTGKTTTTDTNGKSSADWIKSVPTTPDDTKKAVAAGQPAPPRDMSQYLATTSAGPTAPSKAAPVGYQFNPYTGPTVVPYDYTKVPNINTQFNAGPTRDATQNLIMEMLANTALSPDVIAKMKESQKTTLLSGEDQLRQRILQSAASRGVSGDGAVESELGQLGTATLGDISKAYSDVDVLAAQTNFQNKLSATQAAQGFQNQLLQAFLGQGNLGLGVASANLNRDTAADASARAAATFGLQDYTTQEAFKNQEAVSAFSNWLQEQGIDLQYLQNAQSNGLNIARFLSGQ